ncbi:MAG: hypothetical protein AB1485_06325, partial [Candidatus Thermoplasmatota archaeon]
MVISDNYPRIFIWRYSQSKYQELKMLALPLEVKYMNDERLQKAAHAAVRSYIVARIIDDYAAGALD